LTIAFIVVIIVIVVARHFMFVFWFFYYGLKKYFWLWFVKNFLSIHSTY
jgi:hypothetical protein